jgi:hypothetical protein
LEVEGHDRFPCRDRSGDDDRGLLFGDVDEGDEAMTRRLPHKQGPHRRNRRNEVITLTAMLKVACQTMAMEKVPIPEPLLSWWKAKYMLEWLNSLGSKDKPRAELTVDLIQQHIEDTGGL